MASPKKIIILIAVLFITFFIYSCKDENQSPVKVKGKISLALQVDASLTIGQERVKTVNTDSFTVIIYNASGIVVKTFEKYLDVPEEVELDTGSYYVVAHSNNEAAASFENAYYYGESVVFHISPKEVVPVSVTCELYNFFVTVEYTGNVTVNCDDWSTKIWNDQDSLEFLKGETRNGYFKVAPITIKATLTYTKSDASLGTISITGSINDPHRKTHYIITIDAQFNGSITPIDININESSDLIYLILTNYGSKINQVTDIEDNIYNTIQIGTQVWMKENLKTTIYNDGTPIPNVIDNTNWSNLATPAYSWYNNDSATYKNPYGALYNWYAVNTGKLCPVDWHAPSDAEWKTLLMYLGMSQADADAIGWRGNEAPQMKSTTDWNSDGNGTNSCGFTGLPGGNRASTGSFVDIGDYGYWWSSTDYTLNSALWRSLYSSNDNIGHGDDPESAGFSVRCLKD